METTPQAIVDEMLRPMARALSVPDEDQKGHQALITQTEAQTQLPAAARRELIRQLERLRKGLEARRIAAIAAELKVQLKARYSLVIEFRVSKRRSPKNRASAGSAPKPANGTGSTDPDASQSGPGGSGGAGL